MVNKVFIVVAYDISDDKRRNKIAKILEEYGERKNFSVFECLLTHAQLGKMKQKIQAKMKDPTDTVLYYPLCKDCMQKAEQHGGEEETRTMVKIV